MSDHSEIKEYFEKATPDILDDLSKLVSIKSRSVEREACEEALCFVLNRADEMGFATRMGKYRDVGTVEFGEGDETLGILVHVDVVPEGDREKWNTDPFELVLKNGHLYGRGTSLLPPEPGRGLGAESETGEPCHRRDDVAQDEPGKMRDRC